MATTLSAFWRRSGRYDRGSVGSAIEDLAAAMLVWRG